MKKNSASPLPLFLISALHESGGGFLARLFDGHPSLKVYPFELQLGTRNSKDGFEGYCFQPRYRWPEFPEPKADYETLHKNIIDSELKRYLKHRKTSKFSSLDLEISEPDWIQTFKRRLRGAGTKPSRPAIIAAYLSSFFSSWKNRLKSGKERAILGHCPILLYDAPAIFCDFRQAKMVHLIRNPLFTFHDTRLRLPHLKVEDFCRIWNLTTWLAFYLEKKYPKRFLRIRFESLISSRTKTLNDICRFFGIRFSNILLRPSWNGKRLDQISPFGGIPEPSLKYECFAQNALSKRIRTKILKLTDSPERLCTS